MIELRINAKNFEKFDYAKQISFDIFHNFKIMQEIWKPFASISIME